MERRLRPLLPLPSSQQAPQLTASPKRKATLVACESCRKRKTKCGGERPDCLRCIRKAIKCVYEEVTEMSLSVATRNIAALKLENQQLRELFEVLRTLPNGDAHVALDRIRLADDPIAALRFIEDATLLLASPEQLPSHSGDRGLRFLARTLCTRAQSESGLADGLR